MQKTKSSKGRGSATAAVPVLVENARGTEAAEAAEKVTTQRPDALRPKTQAKGECGPDRPDQPLREECWLRQEKQACAGLENCNPGGILAALRF